jgi:DNA-binding NtrC family response regulator
MVIIITGYATINSAVDAIKQGAYDYLPKPFTPEALTAVAIKATTARMRALENACIGQELDRKLLSDPLIGRSEAINQATNLIEGRSSRFYGAYYRRNRSGQEVVARAVHRLSRRSGKRFVTVDCGTLMKAFRKRLSAIKGLSRD